MITYNEAKQLLNQGIFPCIINQNGSINYIIDYNNENLTVTTFYNQILYAPSEDSELSFYSAGGGAVK